MNISRKKLVFAFEWALLIGLTIASGWFASGVFENFLSESSSFSQYEKAVKTHPVIVLNFKNFYHPISLNDVDIYYRLEFHLSHIQLKTKLESGLIFLMSFFNRSAKANIKHHPLKLEIGMNNYFDKRHNKTILISVESFDFKDHIIWGMYKKAYRIIHKTPILDKNMGGSEMIIKYHRQKPDNHSYVHNFEELLAGDLAFITITSLQNSPGIVYETWKDGKALMVTLTKNSMARYYIQPEQYEFLGYAEKCQEESFYGCIALQLQMNGLNNCSKKCMPRIFSNLGINYSIPFCHSNDTESEQCALDIGWGMVDHVIPTNCKKSCSNLRYFGEIAGIIPYTKKKVNNWYGFSYILTNDEFTSKVFKEYLIYDFIGMIGSVGGTLGMLLSEK